MTSHHTEVHCKIFIGERMNKHAVCQLKKCRSVCSRLVHNLPINYQAESVIVEELSPLLVWPAASAERFSAEQTGSPRIVQHIDDGFRQQLTQLYREKLLQDGVILDLMSSWVSHLPEEAAYSQVVGHGMNAQELARNKRLDRFWIRNLNDEPDGWAAADRTFDAVICTVSVQYLQYPERVFAEIYRVLKPGGICIISFSSRLFYQKAIQAWRDNSAFGRINLVKQYFQCVPGFTQPEVIREVANAPPLKLNGLDAIIKTVQRAINLSQGNDPFYAVVAHRNYRPLTD